MSNNMKGIIVESFCRQMPHQPLAYTFKYVCTLLHFFFTFKTSSLSH